MGRQKTQRKTDLSLSRESRLRMGTSEVLTHPWAAERLEKRRLTQTQLESSRNRYLDLFDFHPAACLCLDSKGIIIELNLSAVKMLGVSRSFALGMPLLTRLVRSDQRRFLNYLALCRNSTESVTHEFTLCGPRDRFFFAEITIRRIIREKQTILHAIIIDRSQRRKAEEQLLANQRLLSTAIDASGAGIFEHNAPITRGCRFSERCAAIVGYSPGEIPSPALFLRWFWRRTHPDSRKTLRRIYSHFIQGKIPNCVTTIRLRHRNGHWMWIRFWAAFIERDTKNRVKRVAGAILDITEETNLRQDLERRSKQLQDLAMQLANAGDQERRKIAADLHDNLGQLLAFTEMKLDLMRPSLRGVKPLRLLGEIRKLVSQASDSLHDIIERASFPALELGLDALLNRLMREMREKHHLRISLEKNVALHNVSPELKTTIYRSVRELIINVLKHANTKEIHIVMFFESSTDMLRISVEDEGVGFDPAQALSVVGNEKHFGLLYIRERLRALGGSLELDSALGQGSRIRMTIPLQEKLNDGSADPEFSFEIPRLP